MVSKRGGEPLSPTEGSPCPRSIDGPTCASEQLPATVSYQSRLEHSFVGVADQIQPHHEAEDAGCLQSKLWTQAYDAAKTDDEKLVIEYERIVLGQLHEDDPDGLTAQDESSLGGQNDAAQKRAQMALAVQEGIRVVTSVKEFVGKALKNVPEAAAAWGGANRSGISYVVSRMDWYWELSGLLERPHETQIGLRGELEKHIISLYKAFLAYQMKSICYYYRRRLLVFLRDTIKLDDWEGTLKSIKDAELVVQKDIDTYSGEDIKQSLRDIAKHGDTQCASLQDLSRILQDNTEKQENRHQEEKTQSASQTCEIPTLASQKRIEDTKGGLFEGASSWILTHKDFLQWVECDDVKLLWIKGDPGKGKTMLLMTIIDEIERRLASSAGNPGHQN
ncbi:unnamed protein product [Parascedosporium putredinis]|uniref:Vegetative incompatibility protein HET-E-1 n=1 Tax=Parascedosporium putredinis TaxID=1442378 RepID=A0A9P1GZK7_9PEZI|nr:unnamed protein product [Parascedosporium putredinis]CAI7991894.1 unnamed protein product [Parascedosporium putredinis]